MGDLSCGQPHSIHDTPHAVTALMLLASQRFMWKDVSSYTMLELRGLLHNGRFQGLEARLQTNARSQRGSSSESHLTS